MVSLGFYRLCSNSSQPSVKHILTRLITNYCLFPFINKVSSSTVLNNPNEFYLDKYSILPTLREEKLLNKPDLYQLFQIMLTYHYSDFKKFLSNHPNTMTDFKLDRVTLENKIKLLTLVDLGAKSTIVSFEQITRALDLTATQVDGLVIEAVTHGLCQARIDEMSQIEFSFYMCQLECSTMNNGNTYTPAYNTLKNP